MGVGKSCLNFRGCYEVRDSNVRLRNCFFYGGVYINDVVNFFGFFFGILGYCVLFYIFFYRGIYGYLGVY